MYSFYLLNFKHSYLIQAHSLIFLYSNTIGKLVDKWHSFQDVISLHFTRLFFTNYSYSTGGFPKHNYLLVLFNSAVIQHLILEYLNFKFIKDHILKFLSLFFVLLKEIKIQKIGVLI